MLFLPIHFILFIGVLLCDLLIFPQQLPPKRPICFRTGTIIIMLELSYSPILFAYISLCQSVAQKCLLIIVTTGDVLPCDITIGIEIGCLVDL